MRSWKRRSWCTKMPSPTKPVLDYSYTAYQQEQQGVSNFPGTNMDADLTKLVRSADETIDALADVSEKRRQAQKSGRHARRAIAGDFGVAPRRRPHRTHRADWTGRRRCNRPGRPCWGHGRWCDRADRSDGCYRRRRCNWSGRRHGSCRVGGCDGRPRIDWRCRRRRGDWSDRYHRTVRSYRRDRGDRSDRCNRANWCDRVDGRDGAYRCVRPHRPHRADRRDRPVRCGRGGRHTHGQHRSRKCHPS